MSLVLLEIGNSLDGVFYVNEESKTLEKIEVNDADDLNTNFPGSTEENFSYLKLEKIMKYYMNFENNEEKGLIEIMDEIEKNGFFFGLRPGLRISVKRKL